MVRHDITRLETCLSPTGANESDRRHQLPALTSYTGALEQREKDIAAKQASGSAGGSDCSLKPRSAIKKRKISVFIFNVVKS